MAEELKAWFDAAFFRELAGLVRDRQGAFPPSVSWRMPSKTSTGCR